MRTRILVALACLALTACSGDGGDTPDRPGLDGAWHAWLDSPGGDLPFGLEITSTGGEIAAAMLNGPERIPIPESRREGDALVFDIPHYDSSITARPDAAGERLDGEWVKTGTGGSLTRLDFHATRGSRPRFDVGANGPGDPAEIAGRWSVRFSSSDEDAVAEFGPGDDGTVVGTFMTTTGDYRYLAGVYSGGRLELSCFDGAHAFLFRAEVQEDGTLAGDFWSRDTWHETWTARRDPSADLPDAFALTEWTGGDTVPDLSFPDLEGRLRSLNDPAFAGKARLIEVFGSWCPNCNDSAEHLVELHERYGERGLSILGLAFEHTGDLERDTQQLRRFADHHGIRYPLLVAGLSVKAEASKTLPLIDRVRSYPTAIFVDAAGRVRAVHQGYSGPATGQANVRLRERYDELIEELLAESRP